MQHGVWGYVVCTAERRLMALPCGVVCVALKSRCISVSYGDVCCMKYGAGGYKNDRAAAQSISARADAFKLLSQMQICDALDDGMQCCLLQTPLTTIFLSVLTSPHPSQQQPPTCAHAPLQRSAARCTVH